jgi:prepilin-type N-terminal cleavage/methylation domain-containing protein
MIRNTQRKGFTLIELLIVVVIIGILAAIAIPKFSQTKDKAYVASMKSDLRNLVTAEEGYFSSINPPTYSATNATINFTSSPGVTVAIGAANGTGFNATATSANIPAGSPNSTCGIFYGNAAKPAGMPSTVNEGEPACW